ncbi:hypothetical protein V502_01582 [Pseudogymnoascus sp. VKM F-4520 (FW-2644)]|nr:hypothetical protein V502_01582 [Pseudogymnoascus sp. VKM F-4520 (FW-2644)]
MKIVHHWLPQEVGELMMYYLWLVLPFWEKVQISVDLGFQGSLFIWGRPALEEKREREDAKVAKVAKQPVWSEDKEDDLEEAEHTVEEVESEEVETINNDGIIQWECKKGMNIKMNINAWRNMVKAIGQKFLQHPFEFDTDEEWRDEADEIWEEQFGHSAPMGEAMITSVIWQSGKTIEPASIVFVTPECTGGGEADDSVVRAVVDLVEQLKIKYPAPAKIIVYSQEIKEAEKLSKALGTMLYHAKVDNWSGKDKRLSKWKSGNEESWVVVASKALGLGVDTGDTRAVVHASMPQDLANYMQESRRAGRDGLPSEAIVLLPEELAKR